MQAENFETITNAFLTPHLLVNLSGDIVASNKISKSKFPLLKSSSTITNLTMLTSDDSDKITQCLKMWSRSQTPLPSNINFYDDQGSHSKYRCNGSAIRSRSRQDAQLIMLQCNNLDKTTAVFASLNLKIDQLNREIKARHFIEDKILLLNKNLEQSVNERTSELQHKNEELIQSLLELKNAQEQIIRTERLASLGGMVAGVAHEINTPIGVCLTASSYLSQQVIFYQTLYNQDELSRDGLEKFLDIASRSSSIIESNLNRAASQIRSFKQLAVDQSNDEARDINLKSYLHELLLSLQPYFKKTQHSFNIICNDNVQIETFPGAIAQIVTNLISNSMIHGFENIANGKIEIKVMEENDAIQLDYKDNGGGISVENQSKIFDLFFTTKRNQGGSGLGMNIVYNLITGKLRGSIRIEPKQCNGVHFQMIIPKSLAQRL